MKIIIEVSALLAYQLSRQSLEKEWCQPEDVINDLIDTAHAELCKKQEIKSSDSKVQEPK